MPNQGYVYFGLFGTFDPDELTERIGIKPTSCCAQGARDSERSLPRTSQWEFSTEKIVAECIDVHELAEQIIVSLEPRAAQFKAAIAELNLSAVLEVVLHFSTSDEVSTPIIGFSPRVLAFLVEVNAKIDIDAYILPDGD